MKKGISLIFFVLFIFLLNSSVLAQENDREKHTFDDWEYITNETGLTLTGYLGRTADLELPASIHDIPVTMLGDELFKNSSYLKSVSIPDSVTSIGRTVFQGCSSLTDVKLPRNLRRIEPYTFRYCTSLEEIVLPESLTYIGAYSFSGCINLRKIVMPDTVTTLCESAFDDCTELSEVSVSRNVNYMEGNVFRNTPWLAQQTDEYVLLGNTVLLKWNGTESIADVPYGVTMITDAFAENIYLESVTIPATVTRIGPNAFRDAVNLKNIVIPDTVTRIDSYAFQGDRSLRNITLPETIVSLGNSVFRGCEKLTRMELPRKITSIPSYLLSECTALNEVVIPSSVTSIHATAFSGSDDVLLRVTYDSEGERYAQENLIPYTYYLQQTKDFIYSRNDDGIQILKYIGNLFDVEVPEEIDGLPVNRINTAAFQNNSVARRVILPDSVATIGDWAFSYMDQLEAIRMPSGLVSLGADAFTGSAGIDCVNIPETVETIGVEPFEGISEIAICVPADSIPEQLLLDMGYAILAGEVCDENDFLAEFGITPSPSPQPAVTRTPLPTEVPTVIPTPTAMPTETPTAIPEPLSVLEIPDDTKAVDINLLNNTAYELTLILPKGVESISEDILENHTLTIVSETGTEAEAFAREHELKFLIRSWYEFDHNGSENNK